MEAMFNDKFFLIIGGGLLSWLAAWFVKTIWGRNDEVRTLIKEVSKELSDFKAEVKKEYQRRELAEVVNKGLSDKLDSISQVVKEINQKLDNKADK